MKTAWTVWGIIFVLLLLPLTVHAQTYYADLAFKLDDKGSATIDGTTNYQPYKVSISDNFTQKKGDYWLVNLSTKEAFSDYVLSVEFPQGTEINYIKTSGTFRIADSENLQIISSGSAGPIDFAVQYQLKPVFNASRIYLIVVLAAVIALLVVLFLVHRKLQKMLKTTKTETQELQEKVHDKVKLKVLWPTLTDNQKLIVDLILNAKEPLTQKQLGHRSSLPKATLSRNIDILSKKNILVKQSRGLTNVIMLHESLMR